MTRACNINIRVLISLYVLVLVLSRLGSPAYAASTIQATDLAVRIISCPDLVKPGQKLKDSVVLMLTNTGKKVIKDVAVEFILSTENSYPCPVPFAVYCPQYRDKVLLKGGRELVNVPPGSTKLVATSTNKIPPDTKEGVYYIGAVIDAGNIVPETNERNNVIFKRIYVVKHLPKVQKPDLVIVSAEVKLTKECKPDIPVVYFAVTVKNQGTGVYHPGEKPAYLEVSDRAGPWHNEVPIPELGLSEDTLLAVTLPYYKIDPGYMTRVSPHVFYVGVDPGNRVSETNEKNNSYGPLEVEIPLTLCQEKKKQKLPDLSVRSIIYVKGCKVGVVIQNKGQGDVPGKVWKDKKVAKDARITMFLFGQKKYEKTIRAIDPKKRLQKPGGRVVYVPGLVVRRKAKVKVVVDSKHIIREANEKNNIKRATLFCRRKPDLYISRITVRPKVPRVSSKILLRVTVKNRGEATARACKIAIFIGKEKIPKLLNIPKLAPRRYFTATRTVTFRRAEMKKVLAIVDYKREVREKSEKNNRKKFTFVVKK